MVYAVYVLYSNRSDKYYIGQTNNLVRRLEEHNDGKSKYTKSYRPWNLMFSKYFDSRSAAVCFEKYLKSFKNKRTLKEYIAG